MLVVWVAKDGGPVQAGPSKVLIITTCEGLDHRPLEAAPNKIYLAYVPIRATGCGARDTPEGNIAGTLGGTICGRPRRRPRRPVDDQEVEGRNQERRRVTTRGGEGSLNTSPEGSTAAGGDGSAGGDGRRLGETETAANGVFHL